MCSSPAATPIPAQSRNAPPQSGPSLASWPSQGTAAKDADAQLLQGLRTRPLPPPRASACGHRAVLRQPGAGGHRLRRAHPVRRRHPGSGRRRLVRQQHPGLGRAGRAGHRRGHGDLPGGRPPGAPAAAARRRAGLRPRAATAARLPCPLPHGHPHQDLVERHGRAVRPVARAVPRPPDDGADPGRAAAGGPLGQPGARRRAGRAGPGVRRDHVPGLAPDRVRAAPGGGRAHRARDADRRRAGQRRPDPQLRPGPAGGRGLRRPRRHRAAPPAARAGLVGRRDGHEPRGQHRRHRDGRGPGRLAACTWPRQRVGRGDLHGLLRHADRPAGGRDGHRLPHAAAP